MTDQELKDLVASLAVSQKETDRQLQATSEEVKSLARQVQETGQMQQETDRQLKALQSEVRAVERQVKQTNKQLGELGNRWGSYTEGLIYPSVEKALLEKFRLDYVNSRASSHRKGHNLEIDILGYANSTLNTAFVVEVKSRAKDEDLEQLLNTLAEFPQAFPQHADKQVYGMLAAVDIPLNIRQRAAKLGLYVMRSSADSFKLETPAKFVPKNYGNPKGVKDNA